VQCDYFVIFQKSSRRMVCDIERKDAPGNSAHKKRGLADSRLIAESPALLRDLLEAAKTLRKYEALHRAKGTTESDVKAAANAEMAQRFEQTIARAIGGGKSC
jgi:hypothetical protein